MKIAYMIFCFGLLCLSSCNRKQDNIDLEIKFFIEPNGYNEKGLLKIVFLNNTDQGLVLFKLNTFRKMFGPNQNTYWFDRDQYIGAAEIMKVPYSFDKYMQFPSLKSEMHLHLKAKELVKHSDWGQDQLSYLNDSIISQNLIFVDSHSQKILYYKIKPETRGKYMFSFLQIEKGPMKNAFTRGAMTMDSLIGGKIGNYRFVYKGIKVDSLEVDF
jgi:hypothetical protein